MASGANARSGNGALCLRHVTDGLDVVPVWVAHEGSVIIVVILEKTRGRWSTSAPRPTAAS